MILYIGNTYQPFGGKDNYHDLTLFVSKHGAFDENGYTYLTAGSVSPLDVFRHGDGDGEEIKVSEKIRTDRFDRIKENQILVLLRPYDKWDENTGNWLSKYLTVYQGYILSEGHCIEFDYPQKMLNDAQNALHEYFEEYEDLVENFFADE